MEEPLQQPLSAVSLRITLDRSGIGQRSDDWLDGFTRQLEELVAMSRKLDGLDLIREEPANVFINRGI